MRTQSRIPKLRDTSFDSALLWFSEMQCSNLLFHPEDDPADIIRISSGERLFSEIEVKELNFLLNELEQGIGHEKIIEAAYPVFMHACGLQLDA
ncbi:hypothetical protein CAP31_08670 [Sulfuriferula sp. AH1]|uniref:hypothetical protein n=1 Tax=Sulfuriferula sp. AH1 TaxID=1985873 RepID=UPI000B3B94CB|nr:hypothetical protein [Sulfuriferula sp. AH1]ARU31747.1 hypothetical protein CAP31_08670 [Sulfuriferula sp. AH1]